MPAHLYYFAVLGRLRTAKLAAVDRLVELGAVG
jgi:hypothetical protein